MVKQDSKFRYDINALRAIAVIGVLFFHFKVPYFDGGFSGVDIFFVISGYLMTGIITRGIDKGNFSLLEFYGKRVQRIMPALLFMIIMLLIVNFFIYIPIDYQIVAKNAFASILFISNLFLVKSNYFDPSSDNNIFLHTWSLSVEWQFYLILPLVLLVVSKFYTKDKSRLLVLLTVFGVIIFLSALLFTKIYPVPSFFLLPSRSWEMLAGGISFLIAGKFQIKYKSILAIAGYLILFLCISLLNEEMSWPGIYTLIPVLATFIIITVNYDGFEILKVRWVQFVGKVSYSLYLWHWPVYVLAKYLGIKVTPLTTIILILISFILAWFSYIYIESIKFKSIKIILTYAITITIVSGLLYIKPLNTFLFNNKTLEISNYVKDHLEDQDKQFSTFSCFIDSRSTGLKDFKTVPCLNLEKDKKNFVIVGDSHSAHLSQSLRENLQKRGIHLCQATASGCLPLFRKNGLDRCSEIMDYVFTDYLPKNASNIDGVILSANWMFANADSEALVKDLKETISYLNKLKIKVIILGQSETYTVTFSTIAAREYEYKEKFRDDYLDEKSLEMNTFMKKRLEPYYIDIYNKNNFPKVSANYVPYIADQNHFTKYGADFVAGIIMNNKVFDAFLK